MILEAIGTLSGLIVPPVYDFIKKKFLSPKSDTPEATLATLATTKPELMGDYIKAESELLDAKKRFFNRDAVGELSRWVIDLRGAIRPLFVVFSLGMRFSIWWFQLAVDEGFCAMMDTCCTSWFSSRLI